jgi:hypothetical protein
MPDLPFDEALEVIVHTIHVEWPEVQAIHLSWEPTWAAFDPALLPAAFIGAAGIEPDATIPKAVSNRLDLEIVYASVLPDPAEPASTWQTPKDKCVALRTALEANLRLLNTGGQATCTGLFLKGLRPGAQCVLWEWAERVRAYLGMCGLGAEIWIEETTS